MQNNRGKGRLKYLLQQTELFAHFAKGDQTPSQKKSKGRCGLFFKIPGCCVLRYNYFLFFFVFLTIFVLGFDLAI